MSAENIVFSFNDVPVCPHCRYELTDAWELDLSDGETIEIDCGKCEKPFNVTAEISVSYSTEKLAEDRS